MYWRYIALALCGMCFSLQPPTIKAILKYRKAKKEFYYHAFSGPTTESRQSMQGSGRALVLEKFTGASQSTFGFYNSLYFLEKTINAGLAIETSSMIGTGFHWITDSLVGVRALGPGFRLGSNNYIGIGPAMPIIVSGKPKCLLSLTRCAGYVEYFNSNQRDPNTSFLECYWRSSASVNFAEGRSFLVSCAYRDRGGRTSYDLQAGIVFTIL